MACVRMYRPYTVGTDTSDHYECKAGVKIMSVLYHYVLAK
jgi:hypothetical protein